MGDASAIPTRQTFNDFLLQTGRTLHANDRPPATLDAWRKRKAELRSAMFRGMGAMPTETCPLEPRVLGTLRREGYRIEKLVFQSRPDVWVTGSLYVPDPCPERRPAVLVVHGHWRGARRDPTVQARCLGLVKLGFVVLAVDAFGAGERNTTPVPGTYHGALYGSTLWPTGHSLLGMQVYDNRRAVDYLLTRPEVDGSKLGITGASGGGNQSMYAGALDERFGAVVPVCSVGTYQAYLRSACCVCEVLPTGVKIAEEGDVLALVAPRALMVINATRDSFNFSIEQARLSIERARPVFQLHNVADKLSHQTFESGHDYNRPMRERMYGWMTRWLKNEGRGDPIEEPGHTIETIDDLACYPGGTRPATFTLLPAFAGRVGREMVRTADRQAGTHLEEWRTNAMAKRTQLRDRLGDFPRFPDPKLARVISLRGEPNHGNYHVVHTPEANMSIFAAYWQHEPMAANATRPACIVLHMDGAAAARQHPITEALRSAGWNLLMPTLRATGDVRPAGDAVGVAPDHNSAEHSLWLGRPLLGQWVFDVGCWLDWLATREDVNRRKLAVVGIGHAGIVALTASALLEDRVHAAAALGSASTLVTDRAYPAGTPMALLVPGLFQVGDVPHLAGLSAPRRLLVKDPKNLAGESLTEKQMSEAFAFTRSVYRHDRASEGNLRLAREMSEKEMVTFLAQ